jgi:hypothetical protein
MNSYRIQGRKRSDHCYTLSPVFAPQFFAKVTFLMKKPNLYLKDNGMFS